MTEKRDYINISGTVEFSHLFKPDTEFNPEGVYSVVLAGLSDKAKTVLDEQGVKLNLAKDTLRASSKYKPRVDLSLGNGEYEPLSEDVLVGQGTKVVINGFILKSKKGNAFKLCGVTIKELVEYVPDRTLDEL